MSSTSEPRAQSRRRRKEPSGFLDSSPDILVKLDPGLHLLEVGGSAARVSGPGRDSLLGMTLQAAALFGDQGELVERRCREALGTGEIAFAMELGSPPASRHYAVRIVSERGPDGAVEALFFIGRDETERIQAEQALLRSQQQLAELLEREKKVRRQAEALARTAQRANRIKDEFLATLSHELRTPLNAIMGWTQTLRTGDISKETLLRALAQIEQSAQAQAKLVDDLLHVSDIVAGRLRLEIQPMRLVHSINAVVEGLRPEIDAKQIGVETSFDLSADIVQADPVRIQQILWNVVSNAVKFTPRHGRVQVALAREDESRARITVSDSGEGISPDFLPHVFDRFSQADASSRKRHGGLGLGLAIARYLVEMHGGSIEAQSRGQGRGASFHVHLPLFNSPADGSAAVPPPLAPAQHQTVSAPLRGQRLSGLRVLTVDDDGSTRAMLEEALRRAGAEVLTAESVKDALEKLQRFLPDVLVSDIGMPIEDGYDLVRQLRALPPERGGRTPAIALTGYARAEDRVFTWQAGYQAVAPKPVSIEELVSTIAAVAKQAVEH